jgi:hypothetical protein
MKHIGNARYGSLTGYRADAKGAERRATRRRARKAGKLAARSAG